MTREEEERRREGVGLWWAVRASTLSEEGRHVTAELLKQNATSFIPQLASSGGLLAPAHPELASELPRMPVTRLPLLAIIPDEIS